MADVVRLAVVLLALSLLALPAAATGQNDAGLGQDAPNDRSTAASVSFSTWSGALDPATGDRHDCYRIFADATEGRRISVTLSADYDLRVYDGAGEFLDASFSSGTAPEFVEVAQQATYILCIDLDNFKPVVAGSYAFKVSSFELPDLAVTDIRIGAPRELGDHAPTVRLVEVDIVNQGDGGGEIFWSVSVHHDGPTGYGRTLGRSWGYADPGEGGTLTLEWETLGEIGEAEIRARVFSEYDLDATNDERAARADVLLEAAPTSIDLTHQSAAPASFAIDVHPWETFATWSFEAFIPLNTARGNGWIDRDRVDAFARICPASLGPCVGI